MKALLLSSLILFGSTSAYAIEATNENIPILGAMEATLDVPVIGPTLGLTFVPFWLVSYTGVMTTIVVSGQAKEMVLAARGDARDYLAGEEATNTLVKAVDTLKTSVPEFSEASDEQIIQMIATLD